MTDLRHYDLCVVGGGGAGLAAARTAAALGARVAVVEKRSLGGGYLTQTIPAQAFCAAALQMGTSRRSAGSTKFDFPGFRARVLAVIKDFARDYSSGGLAASNIALVRGHGSFHRTNRLDVGNVQIEAKHFILATGAMPSAAPLPGQDLIRPLLLEDLLTLDRPPDKILIVGASFMGLALAQAFLRLGSQVTLVEGGAILPQEDAELIAPVLTQLAREGLNLLPHAQIDNIEPLHGGLRAHLRGASPPP